MLDEVFLLGAMSKKIETSGVYCIKNLVNEKIYIGSSVNMLRRKKKHFAELRKRIHCNGYLQSSFDKYGESNFVFYILRECPKDELLDVEQLYMDKYQSYNEENGYNLSKNTKLKPGWAQERTRDKISKSTQKEFCKRGHKFTEENSIIKKRDSGRFTKRCRACYEKNYKDRNMKLLQERAKNKKPRRLINKICKCGEAFQFSKTGKWCKLCANKKYILKRELKPLICKMCKNAYERASSAQKYCKDCKHKSKRDYVISRRVKPEDIKKSNTHCKNGHSFEEFAPYYTVSKRTGNDIKNCSECERLSKLRRRAHNKTKIRTDGYENTI